MRKKYMFFIAFVGLLVAVRLVLPYVVLHYVNGTLAAMPGYYGHAEDIDLSLYRGAYMINHIYLNKLDSASKKQTDFFKSRTVDLSLEWGALFHGSIVGKLIFNSPELIFTKDKTELSDLKNATPDFQKLLKDFMPLKVNRFEVYNGVIHYVDNTSQPKVDVFLKQTHILAHNLSNITDNKVELPSTVKAEASVYGGTLKFEMKLNVLAAAPTFVLNAEIKNANLPSVNDFFRAYGNFDVSKGKLGLYTEMAAKNGKFIGYVKPFITDLEVMGPKDRHDDIFHRIWESIIGGIGVVFKNQAKDQLATKIQMEGDFNNPRINTLYAIWEVLRNAFIQALIPTVDHEISINSVKTKKAPSDVAGAGIPRKAH